MSLFEEESFTDIEDTQQYYPLRRTISLRLMRYRTSMQEARKIDALLKYRQKDASYRVQWKMGIVEGMRLRDEIQAGGGPLLSAIFKVRAYPNPTGRFTLIDERFEATESYYNVKWKHTWEPAANIFEHGELIHRFWTYRKRPRKGKKECTT